MFLKFNFFLRIESTNLTQEVYNIYMLPYHFKYQVYYDFTCFFKNQTQGD